jgi:hypothetical protein
MSILLTVKIIDFLLRKLLNYDTSRWINNWFSLNFFLMIHSDNIFILSISYLFWIIEILKLKIFLKMKFFNYILIIF